MEFPHIGTHCHESTCNRLDFLPIICDACGNSFCKDHMTYDQHACPDAQTRDIQVPVCPLCNQPVSSPRNEPPDLAVSEHIDRDCQSDPAKKKRKKNRNKCSAEGCKVKEIIPVICPDCDENYCLGHRFPQDHQCQERCDHAAEAAVNRRRARKAQKALTKKIQGTMSEDEALARALAESMNDTRRHAGNQRCHVS